MKKTQLKLMGLFICMMLLPVHATAQVRVDGWSISDGQFDKKAALEQLKQRQPELVTPQSYYKKSAPAKMLSDNEKQKVEYATTMSMRQMMPMLRPEQVRQLTKRMQAKGFAMTPRAAEPMKIANTEGEPVELWAWSMMSMDWYMSGTNTNMGLIGIKIGDGIEVYDVYRRVNVIPGTGAIVLIDNNYFGFEHEKKVVGGDYYKLYHYNTNNWTLDHQPETEIPVSSLYPAYDPTSGIVYALYSAGDDGSIFSFGYFNLDDEKLYKICDTNIIRNFDNKANCSLLITKDGKFYFADRGDNLYSFDPLSGEANLIGNMISASLDSRAMCIDHHSDKLYLMTCDEMMQSEIYEINPETAEGTLLGTLPFGHWIMTMCAPMQYHDDDAPDAPKNLTASFEAGKKEGTFTFTLPTTKRNGEPLEGTLNYTIMAEGTTPLTGQATAGETVTANVSVTRDGYNALTVKAEDGIESHIYLFAGNDCPKGVTNLTISNSGHQMDLFWDASTEGMNGGYMNPDEVEYIITRYPDNIAVATVGTTTYSEEVSIEKPTVFYYGVKAVFKGQEGEEVLSDKVAVSDGFTLPYHEDFLSDDTPYFYYAPLTSDFGWHLGYFFDLNDQKIGFAFADFSWPEICATDHWLYTPEFIMEPGVYNISLHIAPEYKNEYGFDPSQLSIYFGTGLTPEGMEMIMPPTEVPYGYQHIDANVRVETSGKYRFAFRCTSDNENGGGLWMDEYDIDAGAKPLAPDVPQMELTAAPEGAQAVDISITTPTKTVGDDDLSSITKLEIHRYDGLYVGGERDIIVKTFDNPTPGENLTFTDTPFNDGCFETYWAMAYNEAGRGVIVSDRLYVGQDWPLPPIDGDVWADEMPHITWKAPEGTYYGGYADLNNLTYNIYGIDPMWGDEYLIKDGQTGLSYDDPEADMTGERYEYGDQYLLQYAIAAANGTRQSEFAYTWPTIVGTPYKLPVLESFISFDKARSDWKYIWTERVREGGWLYGWANKFTRDGDDPRCWVMTGTGRMDFTSGRISLKGAEKPHLVYSYYQIPGQNNRLEVKAVLHDGTEQTLRTHNYSTMHGYLKWVTQVVDMSDYAQEDWIMVRFSAYGDNINDYTIIDDIRVFDLVERNLSVKGMIVPENLRYGQPKKVKAYITNTGSQTAVGYHVNMYVNDELMTSVAGPAIESLDNATIDLLFDPSPVTPQRCQVRFEVDWDEDQISDDNVSETRQVSILNNKLGYVSDLTAEENADGTLQLNWNEPANEHNYTCTEDFEFLDSGDGDTEYLGYWKLVDRDGGYTMTINGMNWSTAGDPAAFICYFPNNFSGITGLNKDPVWGTYSGVRCAISMASILDSNVQGNDDWMISTELTGEAQTISLWAKSLFDDPGCAESFQILYSTTGRNVEDFTEATTFNDISAIWTKYEVSLPEGAKYMAIRNIGKDRFMLSIDDVVMRVAGLKPLQYVIWRNEEPIDTISADQTSYTDRVFENTYYVYQVNVIYEEGPSRLSNMAIAIATNGIMDMDKKALRVGSIPGYVEVFEAEGENVNIFTPDGCRVYTGQGRKHLSVAVQKGTYIVRIGDKATKVVVR